MLILQNEQNQILKGIGLALNRIGMVLENSGEEEGEEEEVEVSIPQGTEETKEEPKEEVEEPETEETEPEVEEEISKEELKLQKKIDVIPFSADLNEFIQFILNTTKNSIKVQSIVVKESKIGKKTIIISVRPQDRGKAIGKDGSMIKKIKELVLRHFEVNNVIINTKN